MQNVGAAALFLPVVSRISVRTEIPLSRLLMPMGFCAILGGTMTMVGSSPLILLNDLIISSNQILPSDLKMETFSLFSVTPIGICLVITGIYILCSLVDGFCQLYLQEERAARVIPLGIILKKYMDLSLIW